MASWALVRVVSKNCCVKPPTFPKTFMEEKLLNVLDFRLGVPNVYDFLKLLMEKLPVLLAPDSDVRWLSEYLAELSMQVSRLAMRRVAAPLALLSPPMRTSC